MPRPLAEVSQPRSERTTRDGPEPEPDRPSPPRAHPDRSGREEPNPHPQRVVYLCKYSGRNTQRSDSKDHHP